MQRFTRVHAKSEVHRPLLSKHSLSLPLGGKQADLSKGLRDLIKVQNNVVDAHEKAAERLSEVASKLSDWGEKTGDDAVSDISDKLGVLLAEIAEQEEAYAHSLDDSRNILKQIRNTENSVAPSRSQKQKIQDEIQKLKYKEPESTKIPILEQELVRAEAQSLVAEAQLTNVTRQKLKEYFDAETAAIIERAEKQILLAQQARKLVNLLDDTPIIPGDAHQPYTGEEHAKAVLNEAETGLRTWRPESVVPITSSANQLGTNAMPSHTVGGTTEAPSTTTTLAQPEVEAEKEAVAA